MMMMMMMMNSQKLSTFLHSSSLLPAACKSTVWRAATLSSSPHKEDGNRGGGDTRSMNTPPIEDPQHIKKDISVGGDNDEGSKETYSSEDDSNDNEGLEDTVDEGASTLLKDHSGGQDQSSS